MHPFWIAYIVCAVICLSVCIASIFNERISYAVDLRAVDDLLFFVFLLFVPVSNIVIAGIFLFLIAEYYKPKHWS